LISLQIYLMSIEVVAQLEMLIRVFRFVPLSSIRLMKILILYWIIKIYIFFYHLRRDNNSLYDFT